MTEQRAAEMVDAIVAARRDVASAQARLAEMVVDFADTRTALDEQALADRAARGLPARHTAGEFAAHEIAMALQVTTAQAGRILAVTRRLREHTPRAVAAWRAGDLGDVKAALIAVTTTRLIDPASLAALDAAVVPPAVTLTPPLLRRWLEEFVARAEPDAQDDRIHRRLADRTVRVRPDLDGVSHLFASMATLDAAAVDATLTAHASIPIPGDPRSRDQRRADTLVNLITGRVSNGHTTTWIPNSATDPEPGTAPAPDSRPDPDSASDAEGPPDSDRARDFDGANDSDRNGARDSEPEPDPEGWELPASAHRPVPDLADQPVTVRLPIHQLHPDGHHPPGHYLRIPVPPGDDDPGGSILIHPTCPCRQDPPGPQVTIGVIITARALAGAGRTPGMLADRSGTIPAPTVRDLADTPGTRLTRLLVDTDGHLIDATDLGVVSGRISGDRRSPLLKVGTAPVTDALTRVENGYLPSTLLDATIRWRDGTCTAPGCTTPATPARADLDHHTPWPTGDTTATNLGALCRPHHRAKTHAGHTITRDPPDNGATWTTPTGHHYQRPDPPFPIDDDLPDDDCRSG